MRSLPSNPPAKTLLSPSLLGRTRGKRPQRYVCLRCCTYGALCALYTARTVARCALHVVHCTLYLAYCTLYVVRFALYVARCTLYIARDTWYATSQRVWHCFIAHLHNVCRYVWCGTVWCTSRRWYAKGPAAFQRRSVAYIYILSIGDSEPAFVCFFVCG